LRARSSRAGSCRGRGVGARGANSFRRGSHDRAGRDRGSVRVTSRPRSRTPSGSRIVAAILVASVAAFTARADEPVTTHVTPSPQPPVQAITGHDVAPVRALFNRDVDRPRVLVLLSPT